jgi:putative NADH-flavin reductase
VETNSEVETQTNEGEVETATETNADASLRLNAEGVAVVSPSQVNNSNDLEIFTYNTIAREERVKDIKVETTAEAKSEVEVVYKHESRLFGLMPIALKSTTMVVSGNGELEVDTKLSWWGFLVTDKDRIENEIATRVRDNATIMMSTEYEANASAQAEIAAAVIAELNSYSSLQINNG